MPNLDNKGGYGNYYVNRVSGFFIPPTTGLYVFFVSCDDGCDLFLSTNNTAEHKQLIAQEDTYTAYDNWVQSDANGVRRRRLSYLG